MKPKNPPFRVKICGITNRDDARACVDAGADAIGLNFYAQSSRHVELPEAMAIADAVRGDIKIVGLFVNHPLAIVHKIANEVGLDVIQLHGDEPMDRNYFRERPVVRALRWPSRTEVERAFATEWTSLPASEQLSAFLVDANVAGSFGGTGAKTDWDSLLPRPAIFSSNSLILAGGLHVDNVANAIAAVRPEGVDTASGVELSPRRKDVNLVNRFVKSANIALQNLNEKEDKR